MTLDPCGSLKDTSIADGSRIRSALTLEINCSSGQRALFQLTEEAESEKGKETEQWREQRGPLGLGAPEMSDSEIGEGGWRG